MIVTPKELSARPLHRAHVIAALLLSTSAFAQVAPNPAPENPTTTKRTKDAVVAANAAEKKSEEDAIVLSPFEVVESARGYFAPNSMSGTRFNSRVEDLAASLTVVTKEQMEDFAMLDINDVLSFTAGTEGTATYTDYTIDRNGQLSDNVQLDPNNANRVRGILAANQSYGNFEVNRVPMDRLIIDGLEVSRGPNANVFGLGFAAGTVNQVPATASVFRDRTRLEFRGDSYGGYRSALDFNRVLVKNVLGLRFNAAFQHEGFVRKPSGMNTVRYDAFVKYQPFKNTTISASYLHYKSNGNRPNFTPPRDYVTDWVNAGKPTWDPILQVIHLNGQTIDRNGVVTGGRAIVPITADANIPSYIPFGRSNNSRFNLYIDQSGVTYWTVPGASSVTVAQPSPNANGQSVRLMQTGVLGASGGRFAGQPLWTTTPTVGDHSWYDWSSVNLSAPNRQMDETDAFLVQIDQVLLNTARQTLVVQGAYFTEDSMRYQRQPLGNSGVSGQTGQLFIDVDEKRLDGTPNPNLGRPYIAAGEFTTRYAPAKWDTYRLQAAYKLDLRRENNWLKWFGMHQLTAYNEYKYRVNRQWAYREAIASDHSWTQPGYSGFTNSNVGRAVQGGVTGGVQAGPNIARGYYRYYVGDANGQNVDYAPGDFKTGSYPFVWGGYKTITNGVVDPNSAVFYNDPANLSLLATTDQTGGVNNLKQIIKTPGAVLQSFFLNNSVVTTVGMRRDQVYSKNGINAVTATTPYGGPNLVNNNSEHDWKYDFSWQPGDYRYNVGRTKTAGIVVRPFRELGFINRAANGNGIVSWLAQTARGLSLTYNQSDNFYPQAPAIDLFARQLPNITGEGKDYGFWLTLADDKVVIRFNHYITRQLNIRNGDANTIAQRVLRLDLDVSNDAYQLYDRANDWFRFTHPEWNDTQVRQAIADQMKIPVDLYDTLQAAFRAGTIAATNDFIASGNEVEINVNPTRHWRLSASVTEQKAITSNVSNTLQEWIDQRMPVWTTIVDQNFDPTLGTGASQGWVATPDNPQHLWWLHAYNGTQVPATNFSGNVAAPYKVIKQQEGKSKPSVRKYNLKLATSVDLAAFTEQRYLKKVRVGMSLNWQDKGAIGYYGKQQLPAIITELDPDRPIYDKARLYAGAFVSYRTKLFHDKVGANFQLNVENLGENGRLQPIGAFPDGTPNAFRIVDPQKFILSMSFDL